ncbi:hypothetical protein CEXT_791571 [Caerostris extrusa]|uniref:Uncharacterized protein n=1 Tax=Caerostris extrusa TaxID=172846 RepID=A0AAV4XW27_CAEEX|nr:hypothetical protein CEXT_791571 [Caerostris extrusa]
MQCWLGASRVQANCCSQQGQKQPMVRLTKAGRSRPLASSKLKLTTQKMTMLQASVTSQAECLEVGWCGDLYETTTSF